MNYTNSKPIKKKYAVKEAVQHWKYVAPVLTYPKNNSEYDLLVQRLDELLDIIGENENDPLMNFVDAISRIVSEYDDKHFQISTKGIQALKFLMESNNLKQSDLHEIGSQGVVSEILNGKRELNLRQIKVLSKLFNVSPETFI